MKNLPFKLKVIPATVIVCLFLMMSGCQPEGGELLPIGGEDVEIITSRFDNDTAVTSKNGVTLKLYGDWDGRAKVRVIIENKNQNEIVINFKNSVILDNKGENIMIDSFSKDDGVAIKEIKGESFSVAANEKHKLIIGFPLNLASSIGDNPPRIISVVLSVNTNTKTTEMQNYKFDFKGINRLIE